MAFQGFKHSSTFISNFNMRCRAAIETLSKVCIKFSVNGGIRGGNIKINQIFFFDVFLIFC